MWVRARVLRTRSKERKPPQTTKNGFTSVSPSSMRLHQLGHKDLSSAFVLRAATSSGEDREREKEKEVDQAQATPSQVLPQVYDAWDGEDGEEDLNEELFSGTRGCPLLPRPLFLLEIGALEAIKQRDLDRVVEQSVSKGLANAVLLRDGDVSSAAMMRAASALHPLCSRVGVKFFVEDRLDLVAAEVADGILFNGIDTEFAMPMLRSIEAERRREFLEDNDASVSLDEDAYDVLNSRDERMLPSSA